MAHKDYEELLAARDFLKKELDMSAFKAPVGIVLGSGLSAFAENLKKSPKAQSFSFSDIPHMPKSTVAGHKGELIAGLLNQEIPVLVMSGRLHCYEGHSPESVVFPIRLMGLCGVKSLIITNASGAIGDNFEPGHVMAISDHINLTGQSPLLGPNKEELGPRFVDMTEVYCKNFLSIAKKAALTAGLTMHQGVYAGVLGPNYETPAEIRMFKTLGAHAVGMSTVFEAIAARHMGMKVLGIACLTNKAAGLSSQIISHEEVMKENANLAKGIEMLLKDCVRELY
jgi:purine-nucleoside phosphorylase